MSVVLLRWNPEISSFRMEDFEKALKCARNSQNYSLNWSVWEHEKIHSGDRFFMLRVGNGNTGIVMSGRIVSEPYPEKDWSGKNRKIHYVDIVPDFLIDSNHKPRLRLADLEKEMPKYVWKEGHSGMVLEEPYGTKLEWLWADFLYKNYSLFHKKNFASNACATGNDSVTEFYHHHAIESIQLDLSRKKGAACEICHYDYNRVFHLEKLNYLVQNLYYFFPSFKNVKSVKSLFHCICANCRNIYRDLCDDTNQGKLLPFEALKAKKRTDV